MSNSISNISALSIAKHMFSNLNEHDKTLFTSFLKEQEQAKIVVNITQQHFNLKYGVDAFTTKMISSLNRRAIKYNNTQGKLQSNTLLTQRAC